MSAVSPGSGIPKDSSITTTNSSGKPCCVMKLVTAVQCRSGRIESPAMRVGAARETAPGERRVALVPETVGKLAGAGFDVVVEPGAGEAASFPDDAYAEAGATLGSPWDADALRRWTHSHPRRPSAATSRLCSGPSISPASFRC